MVYCVLFVAPIFPIQKLSLPPLGSCRFFFLLLPNCTNRRIALEKRNKRRSSSERKETSPSNEQHKNASNDKRLNGRRFSNGSSNKNYVCVYVFT